MTDIEIAADDRGLVIPESLEKAYVPVELINERPGMWTLLVEGKVDGKRFAAKLFSGAMRNNGKREAEILSKLDHPNIPKLVDFFEEDGKTVLIREYAEGKPLDRYVSERVISEPAVISIAMKLCRILEYLHGLPEPVIHRDIKPQNIIVDDSGEVRLIDFGISRVRNEQNPVDTVFAGTVAYAAPEQYGFRQTDQRADIYSLGTVLQYMLTGSVDTTSDKSGVEGSSLCGIIEKCTSFAPEKRFRNIGEVQKSLARLNCRSVPRALIAGLLAACFMVGGVFGSFAGIALERGRAAKKTSGYSAGAMPVTPLSAMLGLNDMTEEELLGITGVYIYGNTVFNTLYTKSAAEPGGEKIEVNSYISGHPYVLDFKSGEIEISDGDIKDISCLKYLRNLKQLVISRNDIWDVSPLEGLTQLEFLDLSNNPITDISALSSLTSLKRLYLSNCNFGDLSPICGISSLEVLCVPNTGISGIDGIDALTVLKEIDIGSNGLADVSPIGTLNDLEQISIGDNKITDLSFLRSLDQNKIVKLDIGRNPITDTSPLASGLLFDNSHIIYLGLEYLGKVDLSFLRDINAFSELRLEGTDSSRLSEYVSGKQISWLVANNSGLSNISWLETLSGTWCVELANNPHITDLSPLKRMDGLQTVKVSEDMRPLTETLGSSIGFSFSFV